MKINLPDAQDIKIESLDEANKIIKLLLKKINEMEERESERDLGLFQELFHQKQETRYNIEQLENHIEDYTVAIKSLGSVTKDGFERIGTILGHLSKNDSN